VAFCAECGCRMVAHTSHEKKTGKTYHYYRCPKRKRHGLHDVCVNKKHNRAEQAEAAVWELVSGLLKNPERLRIGLEAMIERERPGTRGNPDREAAAWLQTLSDADQERRGYLRLAAKGQISDEELEEALVELDDTRDGGARAGRRERPKRGPEGTRTGSRRAPRVLRRDGPRGARRSNGGGAPAGLRHAALEGGRCHGWEHGSARHPERERARALRKWTPGERRISLRKWSCVGAHNR